MDAEPEDIECTHCGYAFDAGDPWLTFYPREHYGNGPASQEDMWLCRFCDHSYLCASWRAGFEQERIVKDMASMMNLLRDELRPKPPRPFRRPDGLATGGIISSSMAAVIGE